MRTKSTLYNLVTAAVFAAIIFLATAYLFHIPTGFNSGYIHLGDTFIYLVACILPTPYAMAAASIGAALSDGLTGSAIYVIPTLIIKAILVLYFTSKSTSIINKRNVIAIFLAGITGLLGYYLAESVMVNNFIAPLFEIPIGCIQPIASGILFVVVGMSLDKAKIKQRIKKFY
jgi:uncharacterized repeat protein (TIGR04002 family)